MGSLIHLSIYFIGLLKGTLLNEMKGCDNTGVMSQQMWTAAGNEVFSEDE